MELQTCFSEITFPTRVYGGHAEEHVAPGKLPAMLASKPDNWVVGPTTVAGYLRGQYIMRRKGRPTRRGVKLKSTQIVWLIDITEERKRTDARGNVSFQISSEETLSIHKVLPG